MNRMFSILSVAVVAVCATTDSAQAAMVLIDDFSAPGNNQYQLMVQPNDPTDSRVDDVAGVLGGERESSLTLTAPPPSGNANPKGDAFLDPGMSPNSLSWSNGNGAKSLLELLWDGDGTPALGLNADLTGGGTNDRLLLSVIAADSAVKFTFTVADQDSSATQMLTTPSSVSSPPGATLQFLFTSFVGIDWTNVKSVKLSVTSDNGAADAQFSFLRAATAPEPTSLALLGMAVLPLGYGAWKRNRRSKTLAA